MLAKELFEGIINHNIESNFKIAGLTSDSRKVAKDFIFVALSDNGKQFAAEAVNSGACLVISKDKIPNIEQVFVSNNPQLIYSQLCARFHKHKQPKCIVAITGTNGKTSTADFCRQIWNISGKNAASIGTYGFLCGNEHKEVTAPVLTTPDAYDLHSQLALTADEGTEFLSLEASSHGISQYRLHNVKLESAAFTNITHDHLSYHETMENYFNAKKMLFSEILGKKKTAVLNKDSNVYEKLLAISNQANHKVVTFGQNADLMCLKQILVPAGQELILSIFGKKYEFFFPVMGSFQAQNLLCALGLVLSSTDGCSINLMAALEKIVSPIGRMELLKGKVLVDYAHTPDALYKALVSAKLHYHNKKIISVFGCGGERDTLKRPKMGQISSEHAFTTIVTDDNYRNEDPASIRREILAECINALEIPDREEAIKVAIQLAEKHNGIVLIAGKGHEGYKVHGNTVTQFSDRNTAMKYL